MGRESPSGPQETPARTKSVARDPAHHLRQSPLNMGVRTDFTTTYANIMSRVAQLSMDPKWNQDLKRMDKLNGRRNQYNVRLSAATPGSISPELKFFPKDY